MTAQLLCAAHCSGLGQPPAAKHSCCPETTGHDDSSGTASGCPELKFAKTEALELARAPLPSLRAVEPLLRPVLIVTEPAPRPSAAGVAPPRRDFVFVPETSLGAALRSLAPPAVS
jgi:hypothetical protein